MREPRHRPRGRSLERRRSERGVARVDQSGLLPPSEPYSGALYLNSHPLPSHLSASGGMLGIEGREIWGSAIKSMVDGNTGPTRSHAKPLRNYFLITYLL